MENIFKKVSIIKDNSKIICFKDLDKKKVNYVSLKENIRKTKELKV